MSHTFRLASAHPCGVPVLEDREMQRVLRHARYAHLTDTQFELLLATCQSRGLNPWMDHVRVECRPGGRRNEILIIVTLQALRDLAESTGEHRGTLGPFWCGDDGRWLEVWTGQEPPAAARCGIVRRRRKGPVWATANWPAFAQYTPGPHGEPVLTEFWHRMGPHMLGKCAEALALRKAFPRKLGGLYTAEELDRGRTGPTVASGEGCPAVDETTPTSDLLFQLRLVRDFDLAERGRREATLRRLRLKYPALYAGEDRRAFYAAVLRDLSVERALQDEPRQPA